MSATPLKDVWEASASSPFKPSVSKNAQFNIAFTLLLFGFICASLFGLNNSLKNLPVYGIPASLALGFGAVYMICAVGVYV